MTRFLILAVVLSTCTPVLAQSSASYRLDEHSFNSGGRPAQAAVSVSPSFKLSLDSIGGALEGRALSGASYRMDSGFLAAYPPPGEVGGLDILADLQTLVWDWDPASPEYNLYAGALTGLPGGYGGCAVAPIAGTSWIDSAMPATGAGIFYLVTGSNRLHEEGTKGYDSNGVERGNPTPCP